MSDYRSVFHRDNSVTFWDVYQQQWVRYAAVSIPDRLLATLPSNERDRVLRLVAKTNKEVWP